MHLFPQGPNNTKNANANIPEILNSDEASGGNTVAAKLPSNDLKTCECPLINDGHGLKPIYIFQYTNKHKNSCAGLVVSQGQSQDDYYASSVYGSSQTMSNLWAPFASKMDWEVARWAKLHSSGSMAVSELLSIKELQDKLNLSYKNVDKLNKIINTKLPQWPIFQCCIASDILQMRRWKHRCIIICIQVIDSRRHQPMLTASQILPLLKTIPILFYQLSVYHQIKFISQDPHLLDAGHASIVNSIYIDLLSKNKYSRDMPAQFNTVLIKCHPTAAVTSVKEYCVAQVYCVFTLPEKVLALWFPGGCQFKYFAYVEWFTPLLYIILVNCITQSVHLFLKFGSCVSPEWTSASVLDDCDVFYVNLFSNRFPYLIIY
ncbi:hypothetical protein AN958_08327 [Leucoagaricus sp. SymC.cos]|nr:hypothetical protein AN958_08327 [Leucoagaricus sp. SymC.cos]